MEIKSPYDKTDLLIAAISVETKFKDSVDEIEKKFTDELKNDIAAMDSKVSFNKAVAEHNGISVIDLINSPNMSVLQEQYKSNLFNRAICALESCGLTNKEAWAVMMSGFGLLD